MDDATPAADALEQARTEAAYWQCEAISRSAAIASDLGMQLLAAERLAEAVERHLSDASATAVDELAVRLSFFRSVRG